MSKYLLVFICYVLFQQNNSYGQSLDSTILIKELNIISSKDRYLTGSKIITFDSIQINSVSSENLTEIINNYLPIYIKQDAGGLATIRFRGTSPNHTAIMFKGININSLTLGHSNISNVPNFLFDEIKVQYGSSSSLYGSDAIGGSIHLNNSIDWDKGFNYSFQQDIASFGSYFNGIKIGFSNNKLQYIIKAYYQRKQNDFPFLNTAVKDFEKNKFIRDTTHNAAVSNYGFLQEANFKFSEKLISYVNLWNEYNWHQIQPNMSANYYGGSSEEIKDKAIRFTSGFKYYSGQHKLALDLGFSSNYQLYNKDYSQTISTKLYNLNLSYLNSKFFRGDFNAGLIYTYIIPKVYAYNDVINETRVDFYALYLKSLNRFNISINLRQSFISAYNNRFTPAFGVDYKLMRRENQALNVKFSISSSYKIPTFNDRYWYPNGNPNILPEKAISYEINTNYKLSYNKNNLNVGLSFFLIDIDDLIQWVNIDIWRPLNFKKVRNNGVEFRSQIENRISNLVLNAGVNYSYTRSVEVKNYNNQALTSGKQLMYTPKHMGNAFVSMSYKRWFLLSSTSYTGDRFTESYKVLNGYLLLNASFGRNFQARNSQFSVNFKVNNILNKDYQNQELYAMPGINYSASLKILINTKNKK